MSKPEPESKSKPEPEPRRLTHAEATTLLALVLQEIEGGDYAGPRQQYYNRLERLRLWLAEYPAP